MGVSEAVLAKIITSIDKSQGVAYQSIPYSGCNRVVSIDQAVAEGHIDPEVMDCAGSTGLFVGYIAISPEIDF